jgi:hypothetical protein
LAKYGQVVAGTSTIAGGGVFQQGLFIEYGVVSTDKNWHQNYRTVYKIATLPAISASGGAFFVISKKGYNTTFTDWSGPVEGGGFGVGIVSFSYETSTTYRTYGIAFGWGKTFPTTGTGALISGITTLIGQPYYHDENAGYDPDVGHIVH